jgi:hypothetical protein
MPLMPAGFWASSFGPVMKPSRDIAMVKNTFDIALPFDRVGLDHEARRHRR